MCFNSRRFDPASRHIESSGGIAGSVDVTSTSIDAQLSAAGRTKINEKHTESDSSHVHVQVELGPPAASADGSGGFGWASGDTTEAESSAKRQAAIRAMLG